MNNICHWCGFTPLLAFHRCPQNPRMHEPGCDYGKVEYGGEDIIKECDCSEDWWE